MSICYAKNVFWWDTKEELPDTSRLVLVSGGIARFTDGVWYTETGMDYGRPISWNVEFWAEIPPVPLECPECIEKEEDANDEIHMLQSHAKEE